MTRAILNDDRRWFDEHPSAVVRFRRQRPDEFAAIQAQGDEPPVFLPSFSGDEALTWVAIVDLIQLLRDSSATADGSRLRLRLSTIPIRGAHARAQARKELIKAVATELLDQALIHEAMVAGLQAA